MYDNIKKFLCSMKTQDTDFHGILEAQKEKKLSKQMQYICIEKKKD